MRLSNDGNISARVVVGEICLLAFCELLFQVHSNGFEGKAKPETFLPRESTRTEKLFIVRKLFSSRKSFSFLGKTFHPKLFVSTWHPDPRSVNFH